MDNIKILKINNIHKSFLHIFELTESEVVAEKLAKSYLKFKLNELILKEELSFNDFFKNKKNIYDYDISKYNSQITKKITTHKANKYIKRTVSKDYLYLFDDSYTYSLVEGVVNHKIPFKAFKNYISNIQHIDSKKNLDNTILRLIEDSKCWNIKSFKNKQSFNKIKPFILKEEDNSIFLFSGSDFEIHSDIGSRNWCSVHDYENYLFVLNFFEKIYFYFDFNKKYHDSNSLIAVITDKNGNNIKIFDKFNYEITDKNIIDFYKNKIIVNDFTSDISKDCDLIALSFYEFFYNDKNKAAELLIEYNESERSLYNYFFLLPKLFYLFKSSELKEYYKYMENLNIEMKCVNNIKYNSFSDFEYDCASRASPALLDLYIEKESPEFLGKEYTLDVFQRIERKEFFHNNILSFVFWERFTAESKHDNIIIYKDIINKLNKNIKEHYNEEYLKKIHIDYLNNLDILNENFQNEYQSMLNHLVHIELMKLINNEKFSDIDFKNAFSLVENIFTSSTLPSLNPEYFYNLKADILETFLIRGIPTDMYRKSFLTYFFNDFSLQELIFSGFIYDGYLIDILNLYKNYFITVLRKAFVYFSCYQINKRDQKYIFFDAVFETYNSDEIKTILEDCKCNKTKAFFIDNFAIKR